MSKIDVEKQVKIPGGAKGDLLAGTGSGVIDNLAVGSNDQVLTADSTQATGMKWASPAAAGVSSVFGRSGAVVAATSDYDAVQVDYTPAGSIAATNLQAAITELDNEKQPLDATLTALAALDSTAGLLTVTAADTFARRSITAPAAGITVTNPAGTAGNPTLVLANDLAGVEGLAANGLAARTATDTWAVRTITAGSSKLSVADGDGVSGNPTLDVVEANLTLSSIGGTLSIAKGGTGQTAQTAAFDALAPTTTKGDVIVHNGTDNIRLAIGTNGQVPIADSAEVSGIRWGSSPPGGAGGSNTQIQFNDGGALAGTNNLIWDDTNEFLGVGGTPNAKLQVRDDVDGDAVLLLLENSTANSAASTNETAGIRFAFGGDLDVARISVGKSNDYTSGALSDSFMAFLVDNNGTVLETARITPGVVTINDNDTLSAEVFLLTDVNASGAYNRVFARVKPGAGNTGRGLILGGSAWGGSGGAPTAVLVNSTMFELRGGGYDGVAEFTDQCGVIFDVPSTWTGSNHETAITFRTTPNASTTERASMILRSGAILEVDANVDGDVIRIKQGGTQEGAITVSGTTVAYTTFMGAHPTQTKLSIPQGGVVVATGKIIAPELTVDEKGNTLPRDKKNRGQKKENFSPDAFRFSEIEGTTTPNDKRVYGVYVAKNREDTYEKSFGAEDEAEHLIAAVGLYMIRVTDTNGDIVNGDYLTSSSREWEAQKQADDVLHSYTVAKALADVKWASVASDPILGYKWKLIPATIHCG